MVNPLRIGELLLTWKVPYSKLEGLKNADAIFAFSFGQGENKTPGSINQALAHSAKNLHQKTKLPILAQWEIADALKKLKSKVVYSAYPQNGFMNTKEVADQFSVYSKKLKVKTVIVIAHPDHQYRCGEILKKLGFRVLFAKVEDYLPAGGWQKFDCDKDGYWPQSTHPWTRSRIKFIPFEIKKRLEFFIKDYL